MKKGRNFSTRA